MRNFKSNFSKIFTNIFYCFFLLIVFICFLEALTYPGIFLNKTGIGLSEFVIKFGIICSISYFQLCFSKSFLKYKKTLITFSRIIIFITIFLILIESLTYPNFVFSKLHINHIALITLSFFLSSFIIWSLLLKLVLKIHIKITINKKILIILLLCLTPILSYVSWNSNLQKNNCLKPNVRLFSYTKNNWDESKKTALQDQISWIFKTTNDYSKIKVFFNIFTISCATLFGIILILFIINWIQNNRSLRIAITLILFCLGAVAYTAIILFISVSMFSVGELKAFQGRYILTYILAMLMFSVYLFLNNFQKQKKINGSYLIYIIILLLITNFSNITKLKPADKEIFLKWQKNEILYQNIKQNLKYNKQPTLHTIGGEGPVSYRYFLAPLSVVSPIWQDWDIFMLENPGFETVTNVFLSSASDVTQKWSTEQINRIFKNKKFVINNGLYRVIRDPSNKKSFQLELINSNNQ